MSATKCLHPKIFGRFDYWVLADKGVSAPLFWSWRHVRADPYMSYCVNQTFTALGIFTLEMLNRPGVAEAVLQTPLSLIDSFTQSGILFSKSSKYHKSQTIKARELKFWENVHPWQHVTFHVSHVTCHMLHVTCHLSHVTCPVSHVTFFSFYGQSGYAFWWSVCYQQGPPRLVLK